VTIPALFAQRDPDAVLAEALAIYEAETGVSLAPADPRRLHLQTLLLFLAQHRQLINYGGVQNLLRYVSDEFIDELAAFLGATRLPARPATTTLRLTFSLAGQHMLAAGKRASGGGFLWSMPQVAVPVGDTTIDVLGTCTTDGRAANDLAPGAIDTMADAVPFLASVANVTRTADGDDAESLEAFRARLRTAPDAWAVAGPREAYEALARAVSQTILDVRAVAFRDNADLAGAPVAPGVVRLLVLALGGGSPELLTAVAAACSADEVVPLTDDLVVTTPQLAGTAVDLNIAGTYYIARSRAGEATAIREAIEGADDGSTPGAFREYLDWQTSKMGRDINPDELRARCLTAGAKRLALGAFVFQALALDQAAVIPATVAGLAKYATAVGNGVATVLPTVGGTPAPGDYWLICSTAGAVPVFQLFRVDPATPALVATVDADGAPHDALGVTVTITNGGIPWAVFDLWTFTVQPGPTLAYGGLEDD